KNARPFLDLVGAKIRQNKIRHRSGKTWRWTTDAQTYTYKIGAPQIVYDASDPIVPRMTTADLDSNFTERAIELFLRPYNIIGAYYQKRYGARHALAR